MLPPIKEIKEPDLAFAGLALLIVFGLLIWFDRPIESSRPLDPSARPQDPSVTGHVYESWLWQDPFEFDSSDFRKKPEPPQCTSQLKNIIKNDVKILAPLLNVRSDTTENKELRIRQRYAVIAGLIESGYHPLEPNRLHFCSMQECHDKEYDVRWEHYRHESKYTSDKDKPNKDKTGKSDNKPEPDIIVVWMNSEIITDKKKFDFARENLKEISKNNFYILDLNNSLDQEHSKKLITKQIIDEKKEHLFKPVGADDNNQELIGKLTEELKLRNIKESSEVMIITEQDSENVRSFASNFEKSLCKSLGLDNPDTESSTCKTKKAFYLKGLDAYHQKIDKQDKNEDQETNKRAHRFSAVGLPNPPPLSIGPSQVDYIHRLAEQIKGPHHDLNLKKRDSGIKAVGILGSDFYDKLLVMKALRAEMPYILVFTTDLDAQMLHPQHWRSARNLVVASHFDLLLEDKGQYRKQSYQEQFPVFRDSQQTSTFYTVRQLTGNVKNLKLPHAQIFEVSRNGFVGLATPPPDDALDKRIKRLARIFGWSLDKSSPDDALDETIKRLGLLAAIIFLLVCFHWAFRPNSRKLSIYLLLGELAILAIALFFATDESGEPLSFTDGTSLWPTIFIQLIAVLLALRFCWGAVCELDKNFYRLSEQNFGINDIGNSPRCIGNEPWWFVIIGPWGVFVSSIYIYVINDVSPFGLPPSGLPFEWCLVILVVILIVYLLVVERWESVSIKRWREEDNRYTRTANQGQNSFGIRRPLRRLYIFFNPYNGSGGLRGPYRENCERVLWRQYYNHGLVERRRARVVAIWLFFAIIETIVIYLLPPWPLPCRGSTCGWASLTGVLSFSLIMILLFFILDAMRLSFYWIQKLRTQHPLLAYRQITSDTLESLEQMVTVVAERTRVVDKLIYYPMLCIMLMLFAKITYFDNQEFPLSKGITFAASISLLFFSGFLIRYEAEQLKRCVIHSVEHLGKNKIYSRREIKRAVDRINGISDGAFKPMFEQPVMRALLIILLSIGLFAGKYLNLFG